MAGCEPSLDLDCRQGHLSLELGCLVHQQVYYNKKQ